MTLRHALGRQLTVGEPVGGPSRLNSNSTHEGRTDKRMQAARRCEGESMSSTVNDPSRTYECASIARWSSSKRLGFRTLARRRGVVAQLGSVAHCPRARPTRKHSGPCETTIGVRDTPSPYATRADTWNRACTLNARAGPPTHCSNRRQAAALRERHTQARLTRSLSRAWADAGACCELTSARRIEIMRLTRTASITAADLFASVLCVCPARTSRSIWDSPPLLPPPSFLPSGPGGVAEMNQVAAAPAASSAHMPMQQTRAVARAAADAACSDETATATAATTSTANTAVASDVASKATSAITTTTSTAPAVASSAAPTLDPAALLSTVASAVAKKKHAISYAADRVIGTGSFGVVYQATVVESGESVAIKKVLQDRRFKNRELQIMSLLAHPNVISLKHCFYSNANKNGEEQLYLNLVMDFVPSTLHRTLRDHAKASRLLSPTLTRLYIYQICRSIHYIHSLGVCHRDIKPQNLLLDPRTNEIRLCDFGSAKMLNPNEPNVSYICSRYYRAPELGHNMHTRRERRGVWQRGGQCGRREPSTKLVAHSPFCVSVFLCSASAFSLQCSRRRGIRTPSTSGRSVRFSESS